MPEPNLLAVIDARIQHARARRCDAPRFSEAYWQADDDLAWLRMVRDEVSRTGYVRSEIASLLDAPPVAVAIESERRPLAFPKEPVATPYAERERAPSRGEVAGAA